MDEQDFHRTLHPMQRPGGTLLDIGAHDGEFTRPFAALPGNRVLAFEPLPSAFARLAAQNAADAPARRRERIAKACGGIWLRASASLEGVRTRLQ